MDAAQDQAAADRPTSIEVAVPVPAPTPDHVTDGEPDKTPTRPPPAPWRRWLVHLALFAVAAILIWFALRQVTWQDIKTNLGLLRPETLLLAFLAYVLAWTFRVWRLHVMAHAVEIPLSARDAAVTAVGANALNIVAPARLGDLAAFVHLREISAKGAAAAAVIITWRLSDLGALLVLGLLAGPAVLVLAPVGSATTTLVWTMAGGAGFLALAGTGIYLARHHQFRALLDRITRRLLGARAPTGAAFGQATHKLWSPRVFALGLALALGSWLADVLLAGVILHALWPHPEAYIVVAVPVILANAAKAFPTTPGSIGVYEVVFGVALNQYVGDPALAATFGFAGVAIHLFINGLTLLFGIPGSLAIGHSVSKRMTR